jgi:hypothetical protein
MDNEGFMARFEQEAHSFLIRVWHENRPSETEMGEWRGWIDHVQSGQRHYFRDTREISSIVGQYLNQIPDLDEIFRPIQPEKKDARDDN